MNDFYVYVYLDTTKHAQYDLDINGNTVSLNFEPFYIGKGKNSRMYSHLFETENTTRNKFKHERITKIVSSGHEPSIIKIIEGLDECAAFQVEQSVVLQIGTLMPIDGVKRGPLTNMTAGGYGGSTWSDELKLKHSKKMQGSGNGMFGKNHTDDAKKKISDFRKSFKHSTETKNHYKESRSNGNNNNAKRWNVTFQDGHVEYVYDLPSFCKEKNLSYMTLYNAYKRGSTVTRGAMKGMKLSEA